MSLLNSIQKGKRQSPPRLLIYGIEGVGKAQPLDARILTPQGFVPMGEIKINDKVIGSDGQSHNVIGVYPQGEKEVYRVRFRDGSTTRCCNDHLWFTQTRCERDHGIEGAVRKLREIRKNLRYGTHFNHQVPRVKPVRFEPSETLLPIDPWLMGIYLGDGSGSGNVVITNSETDIRERIASALSENDRCGEIGPASIGKALRIRRECRCQFASDMKSALIALGLANCASNQKFIPQSYLLASVSQRLELLRGLLDSDGYVTQPGAVEYCTVSPMLADDVCFLIRSLGGSVRKLEKQPTFTYRGEKRQGQKAYRLFASFPPEIVPVSSQKHLEKWENAEWTIRHTIRSIEYVGTAPCQCIRTDAPDSLYVTDDFLLTHNSTLGASAPDPIFIPTEDGLDRIDTDSFPLCQSFDDMLACIKTLREEKHDYKTVVIDSLDWGEKLIFAQVCKAFGAKCIEKADGGYGRGYEHALTYWHQLIDALRALRDEKGMIVILIAHAKVEAHNDPESAPFDRFSPKLHKKANALLCEWCDATLLATREFGAAKGEKGGGKRILRCIPSATCVAKNRYDLPEIMPLQWEPLMEFFLNE